MHLIRKSVNEILTDKGIGELFHANSVLTACQFLKRGALLSRGTVERYGYKQTPQTSDKNDKKYSLWYDVFVDTVDIHLRARRANVYGPVLFVLDTELLEDEIGRIWITKSNPSNWTNSTPESKRWFADNDDLKNNLTKGTFEQMVVFRHCGGELPFTSYLKKIILDEPNHTIRKGSIDIYSMAVGALWLAMSDSGLQVPIERRQCRDGCECSKYYDRDKERLIRMFSPSIEDQP